MAILGTGKGAGKIILIMVVVVAGVCCNYCLKSNRGLDNGSGQR